MNLGYRHLVWKYSEIIFITSEYIDKHYETSYIFSKRKSKHTIVKIFLSIWDTIWHQNLKRNNNRIWKSNVTICDTVPIDYTNIQLFSSIFNNVGDISVKFKTNATKHCQELQFAKATSLLRLCSFFVLSSPFIFTKYYIEHVFVLFTSLIIQMTTYVRN